MSITTTKSQDATIERVMHEFKHGELESGPGGRDGQVKSRKQAIAIALSEAGASEQKTPAQNARSKRRTRAKEARRETAMQLNEGRSTTTRSELYEQARKRNIPGRSKMDKAQLERALNRAP